MFAACCISSIYLSVLGPCEQYGKSVNRTVLLHHCILMLFWSMIEVISHIFNFLHLPKSHLYFKQLLKKFTLYCSVDIK